MNHKIDLLPVAFGSDLWEKLIEYANVCSWKAGKNLAAQMRENDFCDWERVFTVLVDHHIAGYCTFVKKDCIPNIPYTPYISYMFVGEQYRGNHLSEKLIHFALQYAKEQEFERVFIVSDHVNFYEKYGFIKIDEKPAPWNSDKMETIFMHLT